MPTPRESTILQSGWHLDKRVQISHILATLSAACALAVYMGQIKTDVELLKSKTLDQVVRDDRQDTAAREAIVGLASRLERIDNKLDRLIEDRQQPRR